MRSSETSSGVASPLPDSSNGTEGFLANTEYSRTAKELNDFVKSIRAEGAQSDLNLPRVAVIGNQSAGKSSLVEAISGIRVPRDAGTCTRCPMELRLSSSTEPWTCRVSIRWERDANGQRASQVREVPFGEVLTDKEDIEITLRRVQAAILNANLDPSHFLDKKGEDLKLLAQQATQKFSRNVICVDLSGPGLEDLSFIDLPGLIQNDEGKGEVRLVEDLAKSYIAASNTLILVAIPMTDDMQNQKAVQLAREVDPNGSRTIGVLTKPDALPVSSTGARALWINVIEGRTHQTKHGYYCTRQPDDAERERNISFAEARLLEEKFFAESAPWASSAHRHRFGVVNLTRSVGERLTELIRADLPRIQSEVAVQRSDCIRRLESLPPKTTDPWAHVNRLILSFVQEAANTIEGSPEHTLLVQANKRSYADLAAAIVATAPPFVPFVSINSASYVAVSGPSKVRRDRGERELFLDTVKARIQACVTRELPNNVPYMVKLSFIRGFQKWWEEYVTRCFDEIQATFKNILIRLIDRHFDRFSPLKRAVRSVVLDLVEEHSAVAGQRLKEILNYEYKAPATQNTADLSRLLHDHLERYKEEQQNPPPADASSSPSVGSSKAQDPLPKSSTPFSFATPPKDGSGSTQASDRFYFAPNPGFVNSAGRTPSSAFGSSSNTTGLFANTASSLHLATQGYTGAKQEPTASIPFSFSFSTSAAHSARGSPSSEVPIPQPLPAPISTDLRDYEEELALMAEVRAYFDISYKRLIDYVPFAIDAHLLYAFSEALREVLFEKLGLMTDDASVRCAQYLAEDPDVAALREDLQAKKKRLDKVKKELFEFGL
ncbi:P-loop containing nucleoside triphosphate hydrolase protein [Trametes meyenii]|nr:P-loop containing nucleoside triphosphate hydrolase protein [Trametes meyenii]